MYTDERINKQYSNINKNSNYHKYIVILLVFVIILVVYFISSSNSNNVSCNLNGESVTLEFNEKYKEPGYTCYNGDNDITDLVEVSDNINYDTPGEYKVFYKYQDKLYTRIVKILEPSDYNLIINYELDNKEYTNKDIMLTYNIIGNTLSEVILPDGKTSKLANGSFLITSNGTYVLKAYNLRRDLFKKEIVIDTIDKEKPTGICSANINNNNTVINVEAHDNNDISKYEYYDNNKLIANTTNNTYTINNSSSNITVKIYDVAGNVSDIKCDVLEEKTYDPIKPLAGETIKFQEETDTLKVYITNNGGYYLTRIWVKDGYSQLNKAVSLQYGSKLYLPKVLLNTAVTTNNLQNKLVLGFNASGFYLSGSYDTDSINKYKPYDKTEVGTIIINNGILFRNAYDHAVKQWYITGINKENKLVIFEDNVANTNDEINAKQKWSQEVINSGIRNTFNFAGPVIQNGQRVTTFSKSMPDPTNNTVKGLQMICQINENNYVLFSSTGAKRNTAIDKFLSLGCQTATNLDGGGSVTLMYKSRNSQEFTFLLGNSRELPAAGYFTE